MRKLLTVAVSSFIMGTILLWVVKQLLFAVFGSAVLFILLLLWIAF